MVIRFFFENRTRNSEFDFLNLWRMSAKKKVDSVDRDVNRKSGGKPSLLPVERGHLEVRAKAITQRLPIDIKTLLLFTVHAHVPLL